MPTPEQAAQLKRIDDEIAKVQKELATTTPELDAAQAKWEEMARKAGAKRLPKNVAGILGVEVEKRRPQQKQALAAYYRTITPLLEVPRKQLAGLQKQKADLEKTIPTTLLTTAVAPRMMRVLPRGNWLDDSGEIVAPGTPASLPPLDAKGRRATRLDLAKWLTAPDNPLTARVFVNRLWKLFYGPGPRQDRWTISARRAAWPTHPELLDWLAVEFRDSGWDVKHMSELMVMSRTYRQVSLVRPVLKERDPYNQLLARQARFRLDAEMVRDNALAVSGLLVRKVGGPSVKPYQPAGYWAILNFPTREWQNGAGDDQYRRGLYTYWCRTFPHPSLLAFDAPSREECTVERPRSNTPLQALVLLNDPTYVEAARVLAERIVREGRKGPGGAHRIRLPASAPAQAAAGGDEGRGGAAPEAPYRFKADAKAAAALLSISRRPPAKDIDAAELAAWTSVARVLLNLHETITRN